MILVYLIKLIYPYNWLWCYILCSYTKELYVL